MFPFRIFIKSCGVSCVPQVVNYHYNFGYIRGKSNYTIYWMNVLVKSNGKPKNMQKHPISARLMIPDCAKF